MTANRDPEFNRLIRMIAQKTSHLNTAGIMFADRQIIKERLQFVWSEDSDGKGVTSVTT